ncbi:response regulator transcription factor [Pedobacter sp. BS3]|uniref:response regulator transcription factor n=1 Tax=Pedobacter sp. BS3 TaxID=2567937 RepID=UPI0011ECAC32|nr:response regulator transcription factor [Pedobacter sp. BS3]TZF84070.1 response regulator transcription factor [Pedobacter sp. BS3]
MSIKVVIIEDQKELREMLGALINGSTGFQCIAQFEDAEDATAQMPGLTPDVALVDIHLPGKSGINLISALKDKIPGTKFMICSSLEDDDNIFNALKAGADGYISKSSSPVKILEAIQDVYNGGSPMSSHIARRVVSYFNPREKVNTELAKLSSREKEILQYLAKGYRYKEVAGFLYISIETVRKHIHNIYEKLQVSSRTDALNKISGGNLF